MSRYEEVRQKIERVNERTTLREFGELMLEVGQKEKFLAMPTALHNSFIVEGVSPGSFISDTCTELSSPCDAIPAIKKCLFWLLDHSDIKKDDLIKPGDYVVGIDEEYFSNPKVLVKLGEVFIAGKDTDNEYVFLPGFCCQNCFQGSVRRATPEEIKKYLLKKELAEFKKQVEEINRKIGELDK